MSDAGDKPFRIAFVRATGKNAGSVKELFAYYGAPNPGGQSKPTKSISRKTRKLHTASGTIPLTDASTSRLITPLISHIITFQNKKVIH